MVNLFEGAMNQDLIEIIYNRGIGDISQYEKAVPEIANSKTIKLLTKFPLNLMFQNNIERQWVK